MSLDVTKKLPATVTSEPQELEDRVRARAPTSFTRLAAGRAAMTWRTGSGQKKKPTKRKSEPRPPNSAGNGHNNDCSGNDQAGRGG
jgi:hypothetical protein